MECSGNQKNKLIFKTDIDVRKAVLITFVTFLFGAFMLVFTHVTSLYYVGFFVVLLRLADSCIYPSLVGYGLDRIGHASPQATSFIITCGSIGIPVGTAMSGLLGDHFGRTNGMMAGPAQLVIVILLVFIVQILVSSRKEENRT